MYITLCDSRNKKEKKQLTPSLQFFFQPSCKSIRQHIVHRRTIIELKVHLYAVHETVLPDLISEVDGCDSLISVISPVRRKYETVLHSLDSFQSWNDRFLIRKYLIMLTKSKEECYAQFIPFINCFIRGDITGTDRHQNIKGTRISNFSG